MKYAVIDIGTNSTRLYVAEISDEHQHTVIKELKNTRLGEGSAQGILQELPMERTANAVAQFSKQALELGALKVFIYATAAVREAVNKNEFSKRVLALSGFPLNIIPGETEALIAYLGAAGNSHDCAVIDIGGGSTEVILNKKGLKALSQKLGAVRLMERYGFCALSSEQICEVSAYIDSVIKNYEALSPTDASELIGVSGTPTTLASLKLSLPTYQPSEIQGTVLSYEEVNTWAQRLCSSDLETRKSIIGMPPERADILQYGCLILARFMLYFGYNKITVSDDDSLKGYLEYILKGTDKK